MGCKYAPLPRRLVDAIASVQFRKKPLEPLLRHVLCNAFWIPRAPRPFDREIVDVGAEDDQGHVLLDLVHVFEQRDGERIGLLAGGASESPDANGLIEALPRKKSRKRSGLQRPEAFRNAEKNRCGDGDFLV